MQLHGPEPDLHAMALGVIGRRPIGGEQGQLSGLLRPLVEGLDHPAPGFLLAVVDFAEIEHLALHDFAAGAALALDDAPVAVLLAVLEASIRAQIHSDPNLRQTSLLKRYLVPASFAIDEVFNQVAHTGLRLWTALNLHYLQSRGDSMSGGQDFRPESRGADFLNFARAIESGVAPEAARRLDLQHRQVEVADRAQRLRRRALHASIRRGSARRTWSRRPGRARSR